MPRYVPSQVDPGRSRYGNRFGNQNDQSQSDNGPVATAFATSDLSSNSGRGRGARKFANQDRFGADTTQNQVFMPPPQSSFSTSEGGQSGFGGGFNRESQNVDGNRNSDNRTHEIIKFDSKLISKLIGKGGSNIQKLQSDTGCKIYVLKETKTELDVDIKLQGSQSVIDAAKSALKDQFGAESNQAPSHQYTAYNPAIEFSPDFNPLKDTAPLKSFGSPVSEWDHVDENSNQTQFGTWNDDNQSGNDAFRSGHQVKEFKPQNNFQSTNFSQISSHVPNGASFSQNSNFRSNSATSSHFQNGGFGQNSVFGEPKTFGNQPKSTTNFQSGGFGQSSVFGESKTFGNEPKSTTHFQSGGFGHSSGFGEPKTFGNEPKSTTNALTLGFGRKTKKRDEDEFVDFSTQRKTVTSRDEGPRFDWGANPPSAEKFAAAMGTDVAAVPKIDWDSVRSYKPEARFKDYPAIIKDFYYENPLVASRSDAEVEEIRQSKNNILVKDMSKAGDRRCPNPVVTFEEAFEKYPEILDTIYNQGFDKPSPIQCQGWPVLLKGDDLIGIAQTGSGKTLAFLLPALIHIDLQPVAREKRGGPNVLVLCPTRELALQIESEVKKYFYRGIKSVCVYGGGDRNKQVNMCTEGVEIVIATPGRLYDLISNDIISIMSVTYVVLDEADRMLDMGFEPQILKCMLDVRPDRQTVMTSATWNWDVQRIAAKYLTDPFFVNVGSLDLTAVHSVTQKIIFAEDDDKEGLLFEMINCMRGDDKMIVFIGKKVVVDQLASKVALDGLPAESIHGGREQSSREEAIVAFRDNEVRVLLATDVASRGLDIVDVTHVVNYDFPKNMEEYVHRVGRTGRAERTGTAISFLSRRDWGNSRELIRILEEADQFVPDELRNMADRFDRMKERRAAEGGGFGMRRGGGSFGGGGGRGRGGGGGGGFGGRRNRDDDDLCMFGGSAFVPG